MDGLLAGGVSMYFLLAIILAVLWFFLPFAIFRTKDRLNQMIEETSKTNKLLEEILDEVARSTLNWEVEEIINAPRRSFDPPVGTSHLQRKQTVENQNLHKTPV